jgi:hypothetical protein
MISFDTSITSITARANLTPADKSKSLAGGYEGTFSARPALAQSGGRRVGSLSATLHAR